MKMLSRRYLELLLKSSLKAKLFHILISPTEENDPVLGEKHITESIQKLREFVRQLWPKKKKRGRMIETDMDWCKTKDY